MSDDPALIRQAMIDRLPGGLPIHVGTAPVRPPGRWVSIYFGAGVHQAIRWTSDYRQQQITVRAVCCGYTDTEALDVADLVRLAWNGFRPSNDPACGPINEVPNDAPLLRPEGSATNTRSSITLTFRVFISRSTTEEL